ncbi:hypothetical protein [Bdellovibrio reynosensis]|uniref:CidA/LrgA family protein n=1 Tax=Bdellovibrio reynosensis TaxID=2835041 RepID=A0ABY4CC15_9BACT|nr:hypothetical protein [Bdellovibrio reynosensis]UOF01427.1 hypothetical protein MNR06_00480 [Bdellovibrio reynosensis]
MKKSRRLLAHYTVFFSGSLVLVYQALGLSMVGDSVNFLCLLFVINGFFAKRSRHILENAGLLTLGYILPLFIRNSLKLSYSEAPSLLAFAKMGLVSTVTTFALGCAFSLLGFLLAQSFLKFQQISRGNVTTRNLSKD